MHHFEALYIVQKHKLAVYASLVVKRKRGKLCTQHVLPQPGSTAALTV
jgi:hypothetical protein